MQIEELTIRGYGKLSNFLLQPSQGVNVLFGPSGAGKSTVGNCIRDVLAGTAATPTPREGPCYPEARPKSGDAFVARVRYRVGPQTITLQRNFEDMSVRARDEGKQGEVPVTDAQGPAPGVSTIRLEDGRGNDVSPQRLEEARGRVREAEREAIKWEAHFRKAFLLDLDARLKRASELEDSLATLTKQASSETATQATTSPDGSSSRPEADALSEEFETLSAQRRELAEKLAALEPLYALTEADVAQVREHVIDEGPTQGQLRDRQRNLEGFRTKEADIVRRLQEMTPLFTNKDDDGFDGRLNTLETDLGRSDFLTARVVERDRTQERIEAARSSFLRFTGYLLVIFVMSGLAVFALSRAGWHISAGIALAAAVLLGLLSVTLVRLQSLRQNLRHMHEEQTRISTQIADLQSNIDASRRDLGDLLEKTGTRTIKELRTRYREFRSLERDLETTRNYCEELEKELELAKQKASSSGPPPKALLVSGVLAAGETVSRRAVSTFLETYERFQSLRQQEEELKKRLLPLRQRLQEKSQKPSAETGPGASAPTLSPATRAAMEKLQEQIRSQLRGRTRGEVTQLREECERGLRALNLDTASLQATPDRLDEYRLQLQEARQKAAPVKAELAALEGSTRDAGGGSPAVSAQRLERAVSSVWSHITERPIQVRIRTDGWLIQTEVRPPAGGVWQPAAALGAADAHLLHVIVEGERARSGGDTVLPAFLDDPYRDIDTQAFSRLSRWIVALSQAVQTFVAISSPEAFEQLRKLLTERNLPIARTHQNDLEILTAGKRIQVSTT